MPQSDFVKEYMAVQEKTFSPLTIKQAWRHSGAWPICPKIFSEEDYAPSHPYPTTIWEIPKMPASFMGVREHDMVIDGSTWGSDSGSDSEQESDSDTDSEKESESEATDVDTTDPNQSDVYPTSAIPADTSAAQPAPLLRNTTALPGPRTPLTTLLQSNLSASSFTLTLIPPALFYASDPSKQHSQADLEHQYTETQQYIEGLQSKN
ncbi:hypothetical protein EDD85DRAFT_797173 [Armillaria nabsnona]|nr:hypothetical protein EDD85DRAFT_797173 [Armillaria nabsnona]